MKKSIQLLIFLFFVLFLIFAILEFFISDNSLYKNKQNTSFKKYSFNNKDNVPSSNKTDNLEEKNKEQIQKKNTQTELREGIINNSNFSLPNETSSPINVEIMPCGFYMAKYNICAGTCPVGVCISEERSCYCKKIS